MKPAKTTSTIKMSTVTKSILQEKDKFLVIILCEDENIEYQQFCEDIYQQAVYAGDEKLAKIQIVDCYEKYLKMEKQSLREYFILGSDRSIEAINCVINPKDKWVVYDSSRRGSVKKIHELKNVVYWTRQIQSLREKLQSRNFILSQKLWNEKYRQNFEKQLQHQENIMAETTKKILNDNKNQPVNASFFESKNKVSMVIGDREKGKGSTESSRRKQEEYGDVKNTKTMKLIKANVVPLNVRSQNTAKKQQSSSNLNNQQKLSQTSAFKQMKLKSNKVFTPYQPGNEYESPQYQYHFPQPTKRSICNNNSNNKKYEKTSKNKNLLLRKSQTLNEEYFPDQSNSLANQKKQDNSELSDFKSLLINSTEKIPSECLNNKSKYPENGNQNSQIHSKNVQFCQNCNCIQESKFMNRYSIKSCQQVDDYNLQKVQQAGNKKLIKNHKLKSSQLDQRKNNQFQRSMSRHKSLTLNYFYNRNSQSDNFSIFQPKRLKSPKNQIQRKLEKSKTQIRNRSLNSNEKIFNSKGFTRQNCKSNQKSSQNLQFLIQKNLSKQQKILSQRKLRIMNEEMSTVESEVTRMSPVKNDSQRMTDKFDFKKGAFFNNPERKINERFGRLQNLKKRIQISKKSASWEISTLYLVDHLMPQQFNQLISMITQTDSIYKFRSEHQLKNQIKQSQDVFDLILVFSQEPFMDLQVDTFEQTNPNCYFVIIDSKCEDSFTCLRNQIRLKSLNGLEQAIQLLLTGQQKEQRKMNQIPSKEKILLKKQRS